MAEFSSHRKRLRKTKVTYNEDIAKNKFLITDLPIINIFQILSYIDAHSLLTKVQLVNRFFKNLIQDDSLWKSFRCLSFCKNEDMLYIIRIIQKCPNLRHIKIERKVGKNFDYDKKCIQPALFHLLSHFRLLRSFSLTNFKIGVQCEEHFRCFMRNLTNLEFLSFDKCYINNFLAGIISEGKNLKYLCLSRCYSIENQTFIKIFKNCQHLEHLNLSQQDTLNDKVFTALFTLCSKTIQTLLLRDISIQHSNFALLKNCSKLSALSIDCHFLNDKSLLQIRQLPLLSHLELSYGLLFTSQGLRNFFKEGHFAQLKHIDLTCCAGLENCSLEVLAEKCQELQSLDLAECWRVTDEGIFFVVHKCSKLLLLNLEDLKELKGAFLIDLHCHLSSLNVLNLSFCDGISSEYLEEFLNKNSDFEVQRCKEYRLKPVLNPYSKPTLLISHGMMPEHCM